MRWTPKENQKIQKYITNKYASIKPTKIDKYIRSNITESDINTLIKKLPNRTYRAIENKVYRTTSWMA